VSYPQFLRRALFVATESNLAFYAWMTFLTALALVGLDAWVDQVVHGLGVTGMTDQVSWGIYIANFTFQVGLAAGAAAMVIPSYLYHDRDLHHLTLVGEILAVSAIGMALAFVTVDIGRPDRLWHMAPLIGRFNWPASMLTWDVIVLSGYLVLNLHIVGYLLYMRFLGIKPKKRLYLPFVMLSIAWAVSIHTVTAFLYCGLGGRPFWNTALLAPRFIASAFVTGPAFLLVVLHVVERLRLYVIPEGAFRTLLQILRVAVVVNLFMVFSEIFTAFYTGGVHAASAQYLYFGLHGHSALVPWVWSAIGLNVGAALLLFSSRVSVDRRLLVLACAMTFVGVWIEKGMGLIIPGFIPSTLGEIVEYLPTRTEWQITVGIWAAGLGVFTLGLKLAVAVFRDDIHFQELKEQRK
jgi:molybdopterin-containing oxidoreductase family membrane subunit